MSLAPEQPKGILKTSISIGVTTPQAPSLCERRVIQQARPVRGYRQEDVRPPVPIEVFEKLSVFPRMRGPGLGATSPSPADAHDFLSALEAFQPSEFADLVEERNCLGNCGYALCPEPKRNYVGEAKIHANGVAMVAELNKWCSDSCARRALFLQVQLSNPTYMRRNGERVVRIELREESSNKHGSHGGPRLEQDQDDPDHPATSVNRPQPSNEADMIMKAASLATERDTMGTMHSAPRPITLAIREKKTTSAPQIPDPGPDGHLLMEGYKAMYGVTVDKPGRPTS